MTLGSLGDSDTPLHNEQLNTLNLVFDFALEQSPHNSLDNLIVETENAIRRLDPPVQNVYRHLAATRIERIAQTNYSNTVHKRHQYILSGIRTKL
jgi:hypothetical protein